MVLRESERFDEGIGGGGGGGAQRQHEAIEEEEDIDLDSEDPSNSHEMHEIASLSDPIVESALVGTSRAAAHEKRLQQQSAGAAPAMSHAVTTQQRRKMPTRLQFSNSSNANTSGSNQHESSVSRSTSSASSQHNATRSGSTTPKRHSVFAIESPADEFKRLRHASCPDLAWASLDDLAFLRAASPPLSPRLMQVASMRHGSYTASVSPSPCASPRIGSASSSASSVLSLALAPLHIGSPPPLGPASATPTPLVMHDGSAANASVARLSLSGGGGGGGAGVLDSARSSASHSRGSATSSPSTTPDGSYPVVVSMMLRSPTKTPPSASSVAPSPRERLAAEFQRHKAERRARAAVRQASFGGGDSNNVTVLSGSIPLFSLSGPLFPTSASPSTLLGAASPMPVHSTSPFAHASMSTSITRSRRAGAADDTSTRSALSSPTDSVCDTASVRALNCDDDDNSSAERSPLLPLSPKAPLLTAARSLFSSTSFNLPPPPSPQQQTPSIATAATATAPLGACMLPAISVDATAHLLLGNRAFLCGTDDADIHVIDCRFPYEFNGGHIAGAVNLFTKRDAEHYFFGGMGQRPTVPPPSSAQRKQVFLFHCEFSSHRGPALLRHVRAIDRRINSQRYPHMSFPDLYLIAGGYVAFCERFAPESAARGRRRVNVEGGATPPRRGSRTFVSANEPRSASPVTPLPVADTTLSPATATPSAMPDSFVLADTEALHGAMRAAPPLDRLFEPHEPPLYTPMDDRRFKNERREYMRARRSPMRKSQSMAELQR